MVNVGVEGEDSAFVVSKIWFVLFPDVCSVCGPDPDVEAISDVVLTTGIRKIISN